MKQLWDILLKDMLPTGRLRLLAGALILLMGATPTIPNFLKTLGVELPQKIELSPLQILIPTTILLSLAVLLVFLVLEHHSSRKASEQFTEYRGASFKKKPDGGYHLAVYCGSCKSSTAPEGSGQFTFTYEKYVCKCGWKSSFTVGSFNEFFPSLKP